MCSPESSAVVILQVRIITEKQSPEIIRQFPLNCTERSTVLMQRVSGWRRKEMRNMTIILVVPSILEVKASHRRILLFSNVCNLREFRKEKTYFSEIKRKKIPEYPWWSSEKTLYGELEGVLPTIEGSQPKHQTE